MYFVLIHTYFYIDAHTLPYLHIIHAYACAHIQEDGSVVKTTAAFQILYTIVVGWVVLQASSVACF